MGTPKPADTELCLSSDLVSRILAKLELLEKPSLDLPGLRSLYSSWCRHVPFDNLRKLIHLKMNDKRPLAGDDPVDFFESWLKDGTGGTCWAGNGALYTLLKSLGFNASRGVATMMAAPNLPPNHGTVAVDCNSKTYIVDASILHLEPLPLEPGAKIDHPTCGVRLHQVDGYWQISWRPMHMPGGLECRINYIGASLEDFKKHHEETRSWSPFNYELYFRAVHRDRVLGIAHGKYLELTGNGVLAGEKLSTQERNLVLMREFGIGEAIIKELPEDRPTPPPPGSKTALGGSSI